MVRAATRGVIDYSSFDPFDNWWWRRFDLLIREVDATQTREVTSLVHLHYVTLSSHGRLSPESFELVQNKANTALRDLLHGYYPWIEAPESVEQAGRDDIVKSMREQYGSPGEAKYEQTVKESMAAIRAWANPKAGRKK